MSALNPYLNFNGNAAEAFAFYESIFGGELSISYMKDAPGSEQLAANELNYVMHVQLRIKDSLLMGSDCLESMGHKLIMGNNNYISYTAESREDADNKFNLLAEGGIVEMPIADMFWGDYFGSLKDKFGVMWMVNYSTNW